MLKSRETNGPLKGIFSPQQRQGISHWPLSIHFPNQYNTLEAPVLNAGKTKIALKDEEAEIMADLLFYPQALSFQVRALGFQQVPLAEHYRKKVTALIAKLQESEAPQLPDGFQEGLGAADFITLNDAGCGINRQPIIKAQKHILETRRDRLGMRFGA